MSHNHNHHRATGSLKLTFFLNLGFTIIEFVGGLWTNSTAILADAVHDLVEQSGTYHSTLELQLPDESCRLETNDA
jgi:Co/Zn/Cd efflux system component